MPAPAARRRPRRRQPLRRHRAVMARLAVLQPIAQNPLTTISSLESGGGATLSQTGFIDHIGIGVPDLVAAKQYYDDLMSVLGLRQWFETTLGGPLNYGPDGARG